MKRGIVTVTVLLVGLAMATGTAMPTRRAAVVRFTTPTIVAGAVVVGTVVFEHDDARMAVGEPCTSVYKYEAWKNRRGEAIVAFMCQPHDRAIVEKFQATCARATNSG